jgi:hypothetical protein
MLKLYIFGYLNRPKAGTEMPGEYELIWFTKAAGARTSRQRDFRKDNGNAIREFDALCANWICSVRRASPR